jgi:hypothetical protein
LILISAAIGYISLPPPEGVAIMGAVPALGLVFGYVIARKIFDLADEVLVEDHNLVVRKKGEEVRIPMFDVFKVETGDMKRIVVLTLLKDSPFGRKITFLSPEFLLDPYVSNPLVKELIELINQAAQCSGSPDKG